MNTTEEVIECLRISLKYPSGDSLYADHDKIMFAGPTPDDMSDAAENDRTYLDQLGASPDSGADGFWYRFV